MSSSGTSGYTRKRQGHAEQCINLSVPLYDGTDEYKWEWLAKEKAVHSHFSCVI